MSDKIQSKKKKQGAGGIKKGMPKKPKPATQKTSVAKAPNDPSQQPTDKSAMYITVGAIVLFVGFIIAMAVISMTGGDPEKTASGGKFPSSSGGGTADIPLEPDPNNPVVVINTDKGTIKAELFKEQAPITVENFLQYVKKGHYDGTIFHRVISDFMIQGGGYTPAMIEKASGPGIKNESYNGLPNDRGTLAMARTNDPNSATAQFFINVKDNKFLNKANAKDGFGYAVFGRVIQGMDVVDKIRYVQTNAGDAPLTPVVIRSIQLLPKQAEKKETKNKAESRSKDDTTKKKDKG